MWEKIEAFKYIKIWGVFSGDVRFRESFKLDKKMKDAIAWWNNVHVVQSMIESNCSQYSSIVTVVLWKMKIQGPQNSKCFSKVFFGFVKALNKQATFKAVCWKTFPITNLFQLLVNFKFPVFFSKNRKGPFKIMMCNCGNKYDRFVIRFTTF